MQFSLEAVMVWNALEQGLLPNVALVWLPSDREKMFCRRGITDIILDTANPQ